ncbi:flagellar protein FlaG [Geothrix sp. 21YS21S-4]|uniref:flagellar protein FlaG n=1 Tax=Geothrix sp. 21YS21S-4 TaxID=3068889 RepID=UPI0027B98DDF|nr:flagellar protein FlaG [Geothrix sp. 21YS21S-4]
MADQVTSVGSVAAVATQAISSAPVSSPRPAPAPIPASSAAASGAAKDAPSSAQAVSKESLKAAARSVEDFVKQAPSDLKFMVDEGTGQYYFKIVDPNTQETIRQVPSEEILAMARRLQQLNDPKGATGVIVDAQG